MEAFDKFCNFLPAFEKWCLHRITFLRIAKGNPSKIRSIRWIRSAESQKSVEGYFWSRRDWKEKLFLQKSDLLISLKLVLGRKIWDNKILEIWKLKIGKSCFFAETRCSIHRHLNRDFQAFWLPDSVTPNCILCFLTQSVLILPGISHAALLRLVFNLCESVTYNSPDRATKVRLF